MAMTAGCFGSGHALLQYRFDELTLQFGEVSGRTIGLRNGVGYRRIGEFFLLLSARRALCNIGQFIGGRRDALKRSELAAATGCVSFALAKRLDSTTERSRLVEHVQVDLPSGLVQFELVLRWNARWHQIGPTAFGRPDVFG